MYTKLSPQERLKDLRVVDKHLTLEQLEAQTGLSKAALGNYERKETGHQCLCHRNTGEILRGVHRLPDGSDGK